MYNTERYNILLQIPRILRHTYNKWSILINNSIQINTKFTFTVYEYIIVFENILLSNLIYIYIYIYIIQYNICIYIQIIYSELTQSSSRRVSSFKDSELCVFCLMQHCHNTYTRWSHWFHIHIIFSSCFYLIVVTSRNCLPNCEHDPTYQ